MKNKALEYLKKGVSVIPVGADKIPLISWKEYQTRLPTKEEIEVWWTDNPKANIGIVTGKISNLIVVDVEKGGDITPFPETDTIETGGGGWHLYYAYTPFENKTRIFPLTDVRGDGGYVVAPPSIHKSGKPYKLIKHVGRNKFPIEIFGGKVESKWKEKILSPIQVGSRNDDFTSIVGGLLAKFPQTDWDKLVYPLILDKNRLQDKPLSENELKVIFGSISAKELKKRNSGGEIKDISTVVLGDEIRIDILLSNAIICFKAKNVVSNLMEANVFTWIEKNGNLSHEMSFYLKIKSDSNKEQWARVLSKAFDKKEEKEVYPWTILISKVNTEIERQIREQKQDFHSSEGEARKVEWLHEPFIQDGQINTFFGLGGSMKTMMAMYFASQLSEKGVCSLMVDYENDISTWKDRLNKMSGDKQDNLFYYDSQHIPLAEQVDKLKEVIKRRNIKLVIVDSASMSSGDSTTDEKAAIRLIGALKMLRVTVVLIAHQRKNDGDKTPIGSIQYENQSRNVWNFKGTKDDDSDSIIHLACTHTKANNTFIRKKPLCFKIDYQEEKIVVETESPDVAFSKKLPVIDQIKGLLFETPNLDYKEIMEYLDISKESVTTILSRGKKKGIFKNEEGKWSLEGGF